MHSRACRTAGRKAVLHYPTLSAIRGGTRRVTLCVHQDRNAEGAATLWLPPTTGLPPLIALIQCKGAGCGGLSPLHGCSVLSVFLRPECVQRPVESWTSPEACASSSIAVRRCGVARTRRSCPLDQARPYSPHQTTSLRPDPACPPLGCCLLLLAAGLGVGCQLAARTGLAGLRRAAPGWLACSESRTWSRPGGRAAPLRLDHRSSLGSDALLHPRHGPRPHAAEESGLEAPQSHPHQAETWIEIQEIHRILTKLRNYPGKCVEITKFCR